MANLGNTIINGVLRVLNGIYANDITAININATSTLKQNGTAVSLNGHTHSYLPLSGGTMTGDIIFNKTGETDLTQIQMKCGVNDFGRIATGGTANNSGWMEIATADDATEPIYVRQYSGVFATLSRTATLLNSSGDSEFPGSMNIIKKITAAGISNGDTTSSNLYNTGGIEVRESGRVGTAQTSFNYAPRIGFHWSGKIAASFSFHNDGIFYLRKQDGTTRATLDANIQGNASTATSATSATSATTASKLGSTNIGTATQPMYLNAGTATACTYSLGSTVNSGTVGRLTYYSGANAISSSGGAAYLTGNSDASSAATKTMLHIFGTTYGNDAAYMKSGTAGLFTFGDGGPQITFDTNATPGGGQGGALIFTDHDSAGTGVSWHFVSNQSDWNVTSKRFHARTSISIGQNLPNTSYNLYVNGTTNITGNTTIGGTLAVTGAITQNGTAVSLNGHTHSYLPLSGGTMTGGITCSTSGANLKFGNITIYGGGTNGGINSMLVGDDVTIGDCNVGGCFGMKSTGTNAGFRFYNSSGTSIGGLQSTNGTLQWFNASGNAYNVYHTGNKPTAADVGAVYTGGTGISISGTTVSINNSGISPYEEKLQWGGGNITGGVSPIGMSLSNEHNCNRLAYINGDALTFEYSSNGGSTYTAYNYTKAQKSAFCTTNFEVPIGRTSGNYTTSSRTRITLTAQNGTTGYVYTDPRKLLINVTTSGGMNVLVEYRTGTNYQNNGAWSTFGTYSLSGWSGWNDIPLVLASMGGGTTQTSNNWQLRLTFIMTSVNSSYPSTAAVKGIRLYGQNGWTVTSNMGSTGHLYSYDDSQNATFPAIVAAPTVKATGNLIIPVNPSTQPTTAGSIWIQT